MDWIPMAVMLVLAFVVGARLLRLGAVLHQSISRAERPEEIARAIVEALGGEVRGPAARVEELHEPDPHPPRPGPGVAEPLPPLFEGRAVRPSPVPLVAILVVALALAWWLLV